MEKGRGRKVRSDKKREVKPVLTIELKDAIYRLSYITYTPVKDVCEQLCAYVIFDKNAIEHLSQFFKRDVRLENTIYMGSITNEAVNKRFKGSTSSVTVRFKQGLYDNIAGLSYALDCTPSRAVALTLEIGMCNMAYVNKYIKHYLNGQLSKTQMSELQLILKYVNKNGEEHHTWMSLLGHIIDEVNVPIARAKDAVSGFLTKIKDGD